MWRLCAGLMLGLTSMVANAELVAETLRWRQGGMAFEGYLAYDDANLERRPAVLVVPEWWGINDYSRMRAEQLAEMGYLALVVDMYGNGRSTTDAEQAAAWAKEVRGERMRERMAAAFKALQGHKLADRENVAAIGFCFGGTAVLEFAYGGAPVNGVVSFHGNLPAPRPADLGRIGARILVLHGADDPFVKPQDIEAFMDGMRKAKADWQMIVYGNAVHAFSNPDADLAGLEGVAYEERAAERSWAHMQDFFAEIFGRY